MSARSKQTKARTRPAARKREVARAVASAAPSLLSFYPATAERFADIERLFGENGAREGCWCMWWRRTRAQWTAEKGAGNRRGLRVIIESNSAPGVLAYADGEPVGWCAIAPREEYPGISRSRTLKPIDDLPVWSITCFFVARPHRRRGVARGLLGAAVAHARRMGASVVEAYPVEPEKRSVPDSSIYVGLASMFRRAGFREVARRSEAQPIMRLVL